MKNKTFSFLKYPFFTLFLTITTTLICGFYGVFAGAIYSSSLIIDSIVILGFWIGIFLGLFSSIFYVNIIDSLKGKERFVIQATNIGGYIGLISTIILHAGLLISMIFKYKVNLDEWFVYSAVMYLAGGLFIGGFAGYLNGYIFSRIFRDIHLKKANNESV